MHFRPAKVALLFSFFLFPSVSPASPFDGIYDLDSDYCGEKLDTGTELSGNSIRFYHGGRCTLRNPVSIRDMPVAILYDQECWEGGITRTSRAMLMKHEAHTYSTYDLVIATNGRVWLYSACNSR